MDIFRFTRQAYLIQGLLFLAFGILFAAAPEGVLFSISIYLGILAMIPGVVMIVLSFANREGGFAGMLFVPGLVLTLLGLLLIVKPEIMAVLLAVSIGIWVLFNGLGQITNAFTLKSEGWRNWWVRLLVGAILTIFGLAILGNAFVTTVILTIWFGVLMMATGIYYLIIALTMKTT